MRIVFLHGLQSSPHGNKYQGLAAAFDDVTSPDCEGVYDIEARLEMILAHLGETPALLVGSSFGGLAAALIAHRHPELVLGMVLCAPALHRDAAIGLANLTAPAVIIHGLHDAVVPIKSSRAAAFALGMPLVEVEDDHQLSASLPLILEHTRQIQQQIIAHAAEP